MELGRKSNIISLRKAVSIVDFQRNLKPPFEPRKINLLISFFEEQKRKKPTKQNGSVYNSVGRCLGLP